MSGYFFFCRLMFSAIIFVITINGASAGVSARDYAIAQLKVTKNLLYKSYLPDSRSSGATGSDGQSLSDKKWVKVWDELWKNGRPRAVDWLDDHILLADDKRLVSIPANYVITSKDGRQLVDSRSDFVVVAQQAPITFIKSYSWKELLLLLICQSNLCTNYYGGTELASSLNDSRWQKIQCDGFRPIDASFFVRGDQLLLVVLYEPEDLSENSSREEYPSRVYQWTGAHMEAVAQVSTHAARSVAAFNDDQSTILLFSLERNRINELDGQSMVNADVYELSSATNSIDRVNSLAGDDSITSIKPYTLGGKDYVILTYDGGPAAIFARNGFELVKLMSTDPEIKSHPNSASVITTRRNKALLFLLHQDSLQVYDVTEQSLIRMKELSLKNQHVDEIAVLEGDNNSIFVVFIKHSFAGTFSIELWQLQDRREDDRELDDVLDCFEELKSLLDDRAPVVGKLKENLSKLSPPRASIISRGSPVKIPSLLVLDGGEAPLMLKFEDDKEFLMSPLDLKSELEKLEEKVSTIAGNGDKTFFSGHTLVDGDARVTNFIIDYLKVERFNGQAIDATRVFLPVLNQSFLSPLQANVATIFIDDLQVSSLCGILQDYWLRVNDGNRTKLHNARLENTLITNDTVILKDEAAFSEFNANFINGIDVDKFLQTAFTVGQRQIIKGNVNYEHVEATKLNANKINGKSSVELITKHTDQSLSEVYVDSLTVQHLRIEKINGVLVDNAAKVSEANVVKGKVTIGNLIITDELTVNKSFVLVPLTQSTQVYDEILINGDVLVKNLEIEDAASLLVAAGAQSVDRLLGDSWSKSRNQTIRDTVALERGASIDELSCDHLNGLGERDFFYANVREMADLDNVTFASVHFDKVVNAESSGSVESFLKESPDHVTFRKTVRLSRLSVDNVITDSYNGVSIEAIMAAASDSIDFAATAHQFEAVRVQDRMLAGEVSVNRINLQNVSAFGGALRCDRPVHVRGRASNAPILSANNLQVASLCGESLDDALLNFSDFCDSTKNLSLTIVGRIQVEQQLKVDRLNGEKIEDYIANSLKTADLAAVMESRDVKSLRVTENLNVTRLNGHRVGDVFAKALAKSGIQDLRSCECRIKNARINHLSAKTVNGQSTSNLIFVDRPIVLRGNVSFEGMLVHGNTRVKSVNGQDFAALLKAKTVMQTVPIKHATSLQISGQVSWDTPSLDLHSVGYLLKNAVTKHEEQLIDCSGVTFPEPVDVKSLNLQEYNDTFVSKKIRAIISDSLLDNSNEDSMLVKGTKIFKKNLIVDDLEVVRDINVRNINEFDVDEMSSQIYQKYDDQSVLSQATFDGQVEIGNLITNNTIHGVPLFELATIDKTLPVSMHFDDLTVNNDVALYKLDGIDFDHFKKRRVTLDGNCKIFNNATIVDPVAVLDQSFVSLVNGIRPSNLVANTVDEAPILIRGNKLFLSNLVVEGNVTAALVDNLNITEMYNQSYSKYEDIHISTDMVFDDDVESLNTVYTSGLINGLHPERISEIQSAHEKSASRALSKQKSAIGLAISDTDKLSSKFSKDVKYIERDSQFNLHIPGAKVVRSTQIGLLTVLDIFTVEAGNFCGLPSHCFCRRQHTVQISSSFNYTVHSETSAKVSFNLSIPNYSYGLHIVSSAVSKSESCSLTSSSEPESSQIFWMKMNNFTNMKLENFATEIQGYISDVQTFVFNHKMYVILAIFYDKTNQSYATNTLLYKFDLQTKSVNLVQMIPTEGVKSIHVFQINHVGIHLLIGCVKGKAESLLYRFHPEMQEFQFLRSFGTGGSKHIASINTHTKSFIILSNPDIEALQIFSYDFTFNNFSDYQNLYHESKLTSLNVFYPEDVDNEEVFIFSTTKDGWFHIYEYTHLGKFKLKLSYKMEDIQVLAPFKYVNQNYLFAGSKLNSTVFKIIQQGLYYH